MKIPVLRTPRLILRSFTEQDSAPLHEILLQPDILRYFPSTDPPDLERVQRLIARQLEHWDNYQHGWWAVQNASGGSLMGWCGLQYLPETDETEVGYLLGKQYWGSGYATEAAKASLKFGFENFPLLSIVGIVHPENAASCRVLEKIGMTQTARTIYFDMDCYRYAINKQAYDWGLSPQK